MSRASTAAVPAVSAALPDLAGRLRLHPGRQPPNIDSTRPAGLHALALGRRADTLPELLAALHALCGPAHRLAARLALRAAAGDVPPASTDPSGPADAAERGALRVATAREQLLRLLHDWPRALPGGAPDPASAALLRGCPLWRSDLAPAGRLAGLPGWLAQQLLGLPPADWLAAWRADPLDWPRRWAAAGHGPLARWLAAVQPAAAALATPWRPWTALRDPAAAAPPLAAALAAPGFAAAPQWQGAVPDTGPWCRLAAPVTVPAHNAWMRLVSRLVDLLQLAVADGARWLACGAWSGAPGHGLAWVECARGMLVHQLRLDDAAGGPRVAALQVLAPTDWNGHPHGVLAESLAALAPGDAAGAALLAAAFDPCVAVDIAPAPSGATGHA